MKLLSKILTISGLVLMVACGSKTPSGHIDQMLQRVDAVENQVEALYTQDFSYLVKKYQAIDTTVARTRDLGDTLILMQAYLQQFETQRVVILKNAEVSRKQLTDLQDDIIDNRFDEKTMLKYIQDEEKVLHTMEAQVKYFQEKFDAQKEVVKQLGKE
ncbi:MAG: hypothetical protein IKQ09_06010 [Bacteroidales bacterium]|nr:hypothetical protein [Bacteroidales bacterium]